MTVHFEALGLMLLHFCWQGLAIAAIAKLADACLSRLRPRSRYTLNLCALLAMAVAALATFVYEDIRLGRLHDGVQSLPALEPVLAGAPLPAGFSMAQALPWIDVLWAMGVLVLSLRTFGGLWRIHTLAKGALPVPADLAQRFARRLRLNGLSHVKLRLHAHIEGPFVVGLWRSVVYLPVSAVTALSPDQLDAVLSHELEHIRRADFAWNLLQTTIETLFFYHPAVWWLGKSLREHRELACDDAAVCSCEDPLTYATALLRLEETRRGQPHMAMALNGHETGPSLIARIGRILGETSRQSPRRGRPVLLLVPLILAVLATLAIPAAQVAASTSETAKAQCKIKASQAVAGGSNTSSSFSLNTTASIAEPVEEPMSEEAPAPEATDAEVDPKDFWTGLRPGLQALSTQRNEDAEVDEGKRPEAAWNHWARSAQRWAELANGSSDADAQAQARAQIQAEALQEAADELRNEAENLRRLNDVNAAEIERQTAKVTAQAKAAQAEAERLQREADATARGSEAQAHALRPLATLTAPKSPPAPPKAVKPLPSAPLVPGSASPPLAVPVSPVPMSVRPMAQMPRVIFVQPARAKSATAVMTLNQMPHAVAVAIPAPDIKTDVVVNVRRDINVQVAIAP